METSRGLPPFVGHSDVAAPPIVELRGGCVRLSRDVVEFGIQQDFRCPVSEFILGEKLQPLSSLQSWCWSLLVACLGEVADPVC